MTVPGLRLRQLTFHGPSRKPSTISFGPGLNVVYGASNTGKSFIVDTVDFMLGGRGPLRDIPERVGYDRILLAIETLQGEQFTLQRSTEGGHFLVFEGLHSLTLPVEGGTELVDQHSDARDNNLSAFLLSKINLAKKRVRKNKRGETQGLSFRNLARLIIVNEEEIIQQRSPLSDGNYTADTANTSVFKILLTGTDDSAYTSGRAQNAEEQARNAQIDLFDQLIQELRNKIKDLAGSPKELDEQLERIETSLTRHSGQLSISESRFRDVSSQRRDQLKRLEQAKNRVAEIDVLVERFELLDKHYASDVLRLEGIEEAGSLISAFKGASCPLCGASSEHHQLHLECDGNVDLVAQAAAAESGKVQLRRKELRSTIELLEKEGRSFVRRLPKLEADLHTLSQEIEGVISPNLRQMRAAYGELADKRSEVREAVNLHLTLADYEKRRQDLSKESESDTGGSSDVDLPTSVTDQFAVTVLNILKSWNFPGISRVHFESKARDLVIDGKNRTSFGKGLRAITQAAFSIGLLEYCHGKQTPHPGFVMLDSPLLSYREPDGQDDDLSKTDLNSKFYDHLAGFADDKQVIIIENTDPPAAIQTSSQAIKFTGTKGSGRPGFFEAEETLV